RRLDRDHAVAALLAGSHRLRGGGPVSVEAPPRSEAAAPPSPPSTGRRIAGLLLRWWRRLTAMRTAIVLLFLLALAAVPGSLLPQRSLSQNNVTRSEERRVGKG